jgi:hypothetical protein
MKSKVAEIGAYAPGQLETSAGPADSASGAGGAPTEDDLKYDLDDDDGADAIPAVSAEDAARYIADMVASLAMMAREAELDLLNYLLDMAHVEAEMQARRGEAADESA